MPKPPESQLLLDKQICFSLYSASNAVIRAYRPLLDKLNLTYLQYIVMMVLWEEESATVKTLGQKVHLDSGTLTPLLTRLETKALIIRRRSKIDERVREITLTAEGTALKKLAFQIPSDLLCQVKMPLDELLTLKNSCDKLLKNLMVSS